MKDQSQRPFLINKHKMVLDRETETIIGRLVLVTGKGWTVQGPFAAEPTTPRYLACRFAWESWKATLTVS